MREIESSHARVRARNGERERGAGGREINPRNSSICFLLREKKIKTIVFLTAKTEIFFFFLNIRKHKRSFLIKNRKKTKKNVEKRNNH